jgi:hypothetical protein
MHAPPPQTSWASPTPPPGPVNPYAAPHASPQMGPAPPGVALYTSGHVALAAFLGTALGGAIVLGINEHRLGRKHAVLPTIGLGVLASAALMGLAFVLPDSFPSAPLPLATVVALHAIARARQGAALHLHLGAGGKKASGWAAAGIGLLCLLIVLVPTVVIAVVIELLTAGAEG